MLLLAAVGTLTTDFIPSSCNRHRNLICIEGEGKGITSCTPQVIVKVDHSEWATAIAVVSKADKSVRLCVDYKVTVNPCMEVLQHPLPCAEDIFATLAGGTVFSKLDLSHAYQQLQLEEYAQELLTINTHRSLYRFTRLPFGVSSAPAIFQAVLGHILQGLRIVSKSLSEHLQVLDEILKRLDQHGVKLKKSKCVFLQSALHGIDEQRIYPFPEKVEAIRNAPIPRDVSQLKSYLGLLNYYAEFMPNMSNGLKPLYDLLQKHCPWAWTSIYEEAFQESKKLLLESQWLVHYDPHKPVK